MTGTIDPVSGTHQWNPFAVGQKRYGAGLRTQATSGPVSAAGKTGYQQRDLAKRLTSTTQPVKPAGGQSTTRNMQVAATRAALARRYGRPYPGTTPTAGA